MLITYILLSTIAFAYITFRWSSDAFVDILVKLFFLSMTVWSVGLIVHNADLFLIST